MVEDQTVAMLNEAATRTPSGSHWRTRINAVINGSDGSGVHLAVFQEPYLQAVLDGRKTIESRFSLTRCAPYDRVGRGDLILLKRSGGPVVGLALAGRAFCQSLGDGDLQQLRSLYAAELMAEDDAFWNERSEKRFATLIDIDECLPIDTMEVSKRDRRGWVTYIEGGRLCTGPVA